jgi:hypothetical protein
MTGPGLGVIVGARRSQRPGTGICGDNLSNLTLVHRIVEQHASIQLIPATQATIGLELGPYPVPRSGPAWFGRYRGLLAGGALDGRPAVAGLDASVVRRRSRPNDHGGLDEAVCPVWSGISFRIAQ